MRIEISGNNFEVPHVLRSYAQSRVRLAVQRAARRVSWVGVRFLRGNEEGGGIACQLDAWLRGIGLVTVEHTDVDPYVGLDCAAVRLEQALVRRLRQMSRYADCHLVCEEPPPSLPAETAGSGEWGNRPGQMVGREGGTRGRRIRRAIRGWTDV